VVLADIRQSPIIWSSNKNSSHHHELADGYEISIFLRWQQIVYLLPGAFSLSVLYHRLVSYQTLLRGVRLELYRNHELLTLLDHLKSVPIPLFVMGGGGGVRVLNLQFSFGYFFCLVSFCAFSRCCLCFWIVHS
jgi:hypothetical protein